MTHVHQMHDGVVSKYKVHWRVRAPSTRRERKCAAFVAAVFLIKRKLFFNFSTLYHISARTLQMDWRKGQRGRYPGGRKSPSGSRGEDPI